MTVIKEFSNELISRLEELDEKYIDNTGENENDNPSSASSVVQDESESNIESNGDEEKRRTSDDEDRMLNYILFC
ncbi:hypothetical protein BLOT_002071 [Blomia tropicalis]|nr:hypothetical protein BLOT_002071 [Blomia tropicalis]